MSKEKLANGKGYSTDLHDLASDIVDHKIKTYIIYNAEEHQQTRKAVKELHSLIVSCADSKVHNIVQDFVIAILAIGMIVFLTGC